MIMHLGDKPNTNAKLEAFVARSVEDVEALRAQWAAWPGHRDSDIDFYLMILGSYPEVVRPHVIFLRRNGDPEAIMVGRLEERRLPFKIGYLTVCRPKVRCLTFVYGTIHGNEGPESTEYLVREVMRTMKREADLAKLEFVPLESPLYRLALQTPSILSRDARPLSQLHHVTEIPDSIDDVYRRMSRDRRKHLRQEARKLEAHPTGKPRIISYRSVSELDALFHDCEEIAKKTYQRGLGAGFADTPDVRMRLELAARKGWLRANLLYLGDRPCAFWIGMLYDQTFVSEYMGYDPEFRQFSVGMVLIMRVIEQLCKRADGDVVRQLDWGLGDAEYKAALATKNWSEASVHIFSPTPKGLLLKAMQTATRLIHGSVRRLLSSTNLLPRLRRAWRDHLAKYGTHPGADRKAAGVPAAAGTASSEHI